MLKNFFAHLRSDPRGAVALLCAAVLAAIFLWQQFAPSHPCFQEHAVRYLHLRCTVFP